MMQRTLSAKQSMHAWLRGIAGVCCWLLATTIHAMPAITLDKQFYDAVPLRDIVEFYSAGAQHASIDDIVATNDFHWKPCSYLPATIAMAPRQTLWYRVRIDNNAPYGHDLTLKNTNPAADWTRAYVVPDTQGRIPAASEQPPADSSIPVAFNHDDMNTRSFAVPGNSAHILYIEVSGFHGSKAPLTLYSTASYENRDQKFHWQSGLINGAILGLMIYNLMLWQKTRERIYFAYMLLGLFNLLTIASHQGLLLHFVPALSPEWNTNLSLMFPLCVSMCLAYFIQVFVDTRQYHPRTHQYINCYLAIILLVIAIFLLGVPMLVTTPVFLVSSGIAIFLMLRAVAKDRQHWAAVRWLLIAGLLMPILSAVLTALATSGVSFIERDYMAFMQTTDVMEMLLLSAAMAYKVSQLQFEHKQQLDKASEELVTNAAHNRLLSHLNHEFRTPLNGILGAAELLIGKSDRDNTDTVNMIYQTALPLKILIDDLVNINAISENRKQLASSRFDLEQLLQECTDIFLPVASKQRIRLYFLVDYDLAVDVQGDPYRLRQILINLLGNAFKFTENGIIGVHVSRNLARSGYPEPAGGSDLYRFEVYDSGQTILADAQEKLFRQFEKGANPSTQHGAGLGLSIVKEISQAMGGDCGYCEHPVTGDGTGNLFWFTVNLACYLPIRRTTHAIFDHRRLLVADSNPLMADMLAIALTGGKDIPLDKVSQADQLQHITQTRHIDIALIDQAMMDDGFEHAAVEDIPSVVVYSDSGTGTHTTNTVYPTILRQHSLRKFAFHVANTLALLDNTRRQPVQTDIAAHHYRALVVEDNPTSQIIISEILKRFPLDIDICSNGQEAERAFQTQFDNGTPYQVIFMDCEMPIQDGFATTRNIRRFEAANRSHNALISRNTLIIALTAHNEPAYKMKSLESGMDDFLSKPITIESIRHCLQRRGLVT